jgi:hypothetical protein
MAETTGSGRARGKRPTRNGDQRPLREEQHYERHSSIMERTWDDES